MKRLVCVAACGVVGFTVGCSADSQQTSTSPSSTSAPATSLLPTSPPSTGPPNGVTLPTYDPPTNGGYPTARIEGALVLRSGCVYLDDSEGLRLIVWPPGTELQPADGGRRVVDRDGREIGAVPGTISIGGGSLPRDAPMVADLETTCPPHADLVIVAPT